MPVYSVKEVLHKIRVRLYPSNLPAGGGALYASTDSEAELSFEDVAAECKNRAGFTGNYEDLVTHSRQFIDEMIYQLCDGFAVNLKYFSIRPVVSGLFKSENESAAGHPVTFRFRVRAPLRKIAKLIEVEVESPAAQGRIENCFDLNSGELNGRLTPGGIFTVTGSKLKVVGDAPECGLYFASALDGGPRFKVTGKLALNVNSKLCGVAPDMPAGDYHIVIVSRRSSGGTPLKTPRTITSEFTVTVK